MFEMHASPTTFSMRRWYSLNMNQNTTYNRDLYFHETLCNELPSFFFNNTQKYPLQKSYYVIVSIAVI